MILVILGLVLVLGGFICLVGKGYDWFSGIMGFGSWMVGVSGKYKFGWGWCCLDFMLDFRFFVLDFLCVLFIWCFVMECLLCYVVDWLFFCEWSGWIIFEVFRG